MDAMNEIELRALLAKYHRLKSAILDEKTQATLRQLIAEIEAELKRK